MRSETRARLSTILSASVRSTSPLNGSITENCKAGCHATNSRFQKNDVNPHRTRRAFRDELLREGVERLLSGEFETGKAILRDYTNATIGFYEHGRLIGEEPHAHVEAKGKSPGEKSL